MLITEAAVGGDTVVFGWAGQLWSVPLAGGEAKRLFSDAAEYRSPMFSPDGKQFAYARLVGGDADIYVMPAAGGESRRVTDHPKVDILQSWAPDGDLVFSSGRERDGSMELYKQGVGDPLSSRLPLSRASQGCLSPDGKQLVYVPNTFFNSLITRRNYRGGAIGVLHLLDLHTLEDRALTKGDHNSVFPMWVGDQIFYLSDSKGSFNLAVYDARSKRSRELTEYPTKGITNASYGAGRIAFVRDGRVYLYGVADGRLQEVSVSIPAFALERPVDEREPKQSSIGRFVQSATLSPDGKTAVLEARGDIWLKSPGEAAINLTKTPDVAERTPSMSPDGKTIAYFSDASGEYRLALRDVASGETRFVDLEAKPTYYEDITWSPGSKRIALSGLRLSLFVVDASSGSCQVIDTSPNLAQELWHPTWLDDNRVAYSKLLANGVRQLFMWDSSGRATPVTDAYTPADYPVAVAGDLRFVGGASVLQSPARTVWALQSSIYFDPLVARMVATVKPGQMPSLLSPTQKDLVDLRAGKGGVLFALSQDWGDTPGGDSSSVGTLYRISADGKTWDKLAGEVNSFDVSADGSTVICLDQDGAVFVLPSDAPPSEAGKNPAAKPLDFSNDKQEVEPSKEWGQIYRDTFHMMRDRFYDPNHHGQDVAELERHYAEYLPSITRRADLNLLLTMAFGEISISHLRVGGGDSPRPPGSSSQTGLLGAEWTIVNGHYRAGKVFSTSEYLVSSPLARTVLAGVRPGAYLLEIDEKPVTADKSLGSQLVGKVGRSVRLKFSDSPNGENPYEVSATPVPGENTLRLLSWEEENRRKVEQMSGGRLAYVHLQGYNSVGYANFIRALYQAKDKDGLIIDQRFNGGGITSDWMIQALNFLPVLAYRYPYGNDFTVPYAYVDGPKVLIINEANGSAAETFPLMFKNAKIGTVVGKRTFGAGVGGGLSAPQTIDGGSVTIPNRGGYNPITGQWEIENDGVRPDIEIEIEPKDYAAGRDTQLETAVRVALEQAKKWKKRQLKRPNPPVHPGGRV